MSINLNSVPIGPVLWLPAEAQADIPRIHPVKPLNNLLCVPEGDAGSSRIDYATLNQLPGFPEGSG